MNTTKLVQKNQTNQTFINAAANSTLRTAATSQPGPQLCPSSSPLTPLAYAARVTDGLHPLARNVKGDCLASLKYLSGLPALCTTRNLAILLLLVEDRIIWRIFNHSPPPFHRIKEQLRLERTTGDHLVQFPCSEQNQLRASCSGSFPVRFWKSPGT